MGLGEYRPKKLRLNRSAYTKEHKMECPKGSICKELEHKVKTLDKAIDWFDGCTTDHLPIRIRQITADNGRVMIKIFDRFDNLIHTRG